MAVALLGACGGDESSGETGAADARSATPVTSADASAPAVSPPTTAATGAPSATTAARGGGRSASPPPTARPTAPQGAPAATASAPRANPVAPGRYSYDTDGTTQVANGPPRRLPAVTTLTVDRPAGARQRSVRDLRDRDGVGSVTETILEYADDGVRILALRVQTNFAGITSTYNVTAADRPIVVARGARPGDSSSFILEGDGLTIKTTARVDRLEGDTLVVVLDSTLSGDIQGTQRAVNWISSSRSLTVKEDVVSDATARGVRVQTRYVASERRA